MKHIKLYEELSDWTKELVGLNNYYLIAFNSVSYLSQQPKGFFSLIGIVNKQLKDKGINYIYIGSVDNEYYYSFPREITTTDIIKALKTEDPDPSKRLGTEVWRVYIHPFDEFSGGKDDYSVNEIGQGETVDIKIYDDPNWKLVGSNEQEGVLESLSDWTKEMLGMNNYYLFSFAGSLISPDKAPEVIEEIKKILRKKGIEFIIYLEMSTGFICKIFGKYKPIELSNLFYRDAPDHGALASEDKVVVYLLKYFNPETKGYTLTNNKEAQKAYFYCGIYIYKEMIVLYKNDIGGAFPKNHRMTRE